MITQEQKKRLKLEVGKTIDIIKKNQESLNLVKDGYKLYDNLYHQAMEDMTTYYEEYKNLETFLTIGASGDQLLNAVVMGAKKIDVFDINCLSKRGCALKIASAETLNPDELQEFFLNFGEDEYRYISNNLGEEDLIYWNAVYDFVGEEGVRKLFPYIKLNKELVKKINPYLNRDNYQEFQNKLQDVQINYMDCSLYDLEKLLGDNTYDGMNFSNIYEYLNYEQDVSKEKAQEFYKFIMQKMYPRLNRNGTMMISYMYAFSDKVKEDFDEMYKINSNQLVLSNVTTINQLSQFMMGLTSQNYAYSLLLDAFKGEFIKKVVTDHVQFGQSKDMSHDMALCLKK